MSARSPKGTVLAKPKAVQARAMKPARRQGTTGLRAVKPARRQAAAALRTMSELMAYAYALEVEASERYSEFAEAMAVHNNHEVAELFRKLGLEPGMLAVAAVKATNVSVEIPKSS